jgi:hypothetical protein
MQALGFEVISAPDPVKYGATSPHAKEGGPWVVVFNDFLTDREVADLVRGGELEGYDRSTDQGASNELGEMEKVVSRTRTRCVGAARARRRVGRVSPLRVLTPCPRGRAAPTRGACTSASGWPG